MHGPRPDMGSGAVIAPAKGGSRRKSGAVPATVIRPPPDSQIPARCRRPLSGRVQPKIVGGSRPTVARLPSVTTVMDMEGY